MHALTDTKHGKNCNFRPLFWTEPDMNFWYPQSAYFLVKHDELTKSVGILQNLGTFQIRRNHTEVNFEYFQI